jgi:hypothetical protein
MHLPHRQSGGRTLKSSVPTGREAFSCQGQCNSSGSYRYGGGLTVRNKSWSRLFLALTQIKLSFLYDKTATSIMRRQDRFGATTEGSRTMASKGGSGNRRRCQHRPPRYHEAMQKFSGASFVLMTAGGSG